MIYDLKVQKLILHEEELSYHVNQFFLFPYSFYVTCTKPGKQTNHIR